VASIVIEFGQLTEAQLALIAANPMQAADVTGMIEVDDRWHATFAVDDDVTVDAFYDDLRGWAIGHALPITGMVDS
jgi:hypothetical protein